MSQTETLREKVALVTGASRGIGRAIALSLAEAGADLVLTSTREGGTREAHAAAEALGRKVLSVPCDLSRTADVDALVARAGAVDLLVNNAGTVVWKHAVDTSDAEFAQVLAVNLVAPFQLARRLLPGMLARGSGRIVNVSSISGTMGTPRLSAYCASKWGLNGFTKALAEELRGTGVSVYAVMPGSTDTDMLKGSGFTATMQPAEIAGTVRYLCSDAPAGMNGSLVEVFG